MESSDVLKRNVSGISSSDSAVDAESDEMATVVTSDAGGREETVVVAICDAMLTQRAVVGSWRNIDAAVQTTFPVAAWQCVTADVAAETAALPHEQKIAKYLQKTPIGSQSESYYGNQ